MQLSPIQRIAPADGRPLPRAGVGYLAAGIVALVVSSADADRGIDDLSCAIAEPVHREACCTGKKWTVEGETMSPNASACLAYAQCVERQESSFRSDERFCNTYAHRLSADCLSKARESRKKFLAFCASDTRKRVKAAAVSAEQRKKDAAAKAEQVKKDAERAAVISKGDQASRCLTVFPVSETLRPSDEDLEKARADEALARKALVAAAESEKPHLSAELSSKVAILRGMESRLAAYESAKRAWDDCKALITLWRGGRSDRTDGEILAEVSAARSKAIGLGSMSEFDSGLSYDATVDRLLNTAPKLIAEDKARRERLEKFAESLYSSQAAAPTEPQPPNSWATISANSVARGVTIACIAFSAVLCWPLESRLRTRQPASRPYAWGYYIGLNGALFGMVGAAMTFVAFLNDYGSSKETTLVAFAYFVLLAFTHGLILLRSKVGWVLGIALQLNPVSWLANGIYARNRWAEFRGGVAIPDSVRASVRADILLWRRAVALAFFWVVLVVVAVWAFEPYGPYMSERDQFRTIKIMFSPPVLGLLALGVWRWLNASGRSESAG